MPALAGRVGDVEALGLLTRVIRTRRSKANDYLDISKAPRLISVIAVATNASIDPQGVIPAQQIIEKWACTVPVLALPPQPP